MMLTVFEDCELILQSLRAGATGHLLKQSIPHQFTGAIRDLHQGGSPMSNSITRKVVLAFQAVPSRPESTGSLTPRERMIVERLARGHSCKEIADDLGVSFNTVRTHVQNIYQKLQVRSKAEAVRRVFGQGGNSP
jgi:DNA-binding NarL/FixJ family response regulator